MDNNCNLNAACPRAGLTTQQPAQYNACKKPQQAVEDVDGCKSLAHSPHIDPTHTNIRKQGSRRCLLAPRPSRHRRPANSRPEFYAPSPPRLFPAWSTLPLLQAEGAKAAPPAAGYYRLAWRVVDLRVYFPNLSLICKSGILTLSSYWLSASPHVTCIF
jgi:hypothetical protein